MAINKDVTEDLPYSLSNPISSVSYTPTAEDYDVSFGVYPFFLGTTDEFPYRRQTAPYRKQQIDQSNEPGEQSLSNWWLRSQSSFHKGSGIRFYDPTAGETVPYRFTDSRGVDVWTKGKVTLLKDVTPVHLTTGTIRANGRPAQFSRSVRYGTTNGVLLADDYDVDKITDAGQVHFVDYNSGADTPVFAICDDGQFAYWVTNSAASNSKLTVFKKLLTQTSVDADTQMFQQNGLVVTNAVMEFVKERIVMCANNSIYEFSSTASAMPTAVYTHPNPDYVFTSVTASGPAIYVSGYNGIKSVIHKFTLTTGTGSMPTLTSAITAAEMPEGEVIHKIFFYLGYMMIGTSKGVRAALVSDQDGSINYGPLIVETTGPVYDFASRDKFVWCTATIGTSPGTIRINLGEEIETLRFAYANDIYAPTITNGAVSTALAFIGNTSRLCFSTNALSAASGDEGSNYLESATNYISTGYLQTGYIRYATIEDKVFKTLHVNMENANGSLTVQSISKEGNQYTIANFGAGDLIEPFAVAYPLGTQEYVSFKFNFTPKTTTVTPTFSAYQLKALPAIARQRFIQYPVLCYDTESDKFGNQKGYDGFAFYRINQLEELESTGDTIRIQDFRNGETYLGVIEELTFINRTPSSPRFSGFGGVFLVTIRTVS
jgi:hypothetical protein